jgi:hypothetical protein
VNKLGVVELQRRELAIFLTAREELFAYNEVPTFAVANDCWFRARRQPTRPFFFFTVLIQALKRIL